MDADPDGRGHQRRPHAGEEPQAGVDVAVVVDKADGSEAGGAQAMAPYPGRQGGREEQAPQAAGDEGGAAEVGDRPAVGL